jgi:MFS family permease
MQSVALSWLVLQLTGSGTMLGLVVATQFLPVLVFGAYGGLIADRVDKRRLLLATQTALGLLALALGMLILTHAVRQRLVFVLAAAMGVVNAVGAPVQQTFVAEMVGRDRLQTRSASIAC